MAAFSPTGVRPVVQVHPSDFCNLACAHCYSSSGPDASGVLEPALLHRCLDDAHALGYRDLAVSGGEPLLYGGLADLLTHARALGMHTALTTNGMPLTDRRWDGLAGLVDIVAVSIDGRPAEHDAIRRRQGAYRRTLANLPVLRRSGVPFGFIFTLTQHNVDSLDHVVRLAAETGARSVQVHPLTTTGRAVTDMAGERPDAVERLAALVEAGRTGAALGVRVHVDLVTAGQLVAYRSRMIPERPVLRLVDAAPTLVVRTDGSVVPLSHEVDRALHLGRLADAPLATLAEAWLADGRADALARACEVTWADLADHHPSSPFYWYDEVAARTCPAPPPIH